MNDVHSASPNTVDDGAGYLPVPFALVDHVEALVWARFGPTAQERTAPLMPHGGLLLTVSLPDVQAAHRLVSYIGLRRLTDAQARLRTKRAGCTSLFALLKPAGALRLMQQARVGESDSDRLPLHVLLGLEQERRLADAVQRSCGEAAQLKTLAAWLEDMCLQSGAPSGQQRLSHAVSLLHAKPSIELPDVWQATGLGRRSLERQLRAWFGTTPKEQQRFARLQHSARLAWQQVPAVDIAHELGFADQPHFSRTVNSMTGMTAGMFVKRMDSRLSRAFRMATGGGNLMPCAFNAITDAV